MVKLQRLTNLARISVKPYFLSIPYYANEIGHTRSYSALRNWVYFKIPFAFKKAAYPLYVTFEFTTRCNLGCTMCWRPNSLKTRGIGSMALSTFDKVIREFAAAKTCPCVIKIGGSGEPALHADFQEMMTTLDLLKKRSVKVAIYTNGTLFERFSTEEIMKWNLHRIGVSIDGLDRESYERIRIGGDYDKLIKLVRKFREERDRLSGPKPLIEICHTIVEDESLLQLMRFKRQWQPPADVVKFQSVHPVGKLAGPASIRGTRRELPIQWNGNVPIYTRPGSIGNVTSQSIDELWSDFAGITQTMQANTESPQIAETTSIVETRASPTVLHQHSRPTV
jgi:uncharacterized Fe-S cluster-containing radical SAM superfamily protein